MIDGWKCSACDWETFDGDVMRDQVMWREPDGSFTLKCPSCGTEGAFVDADWVAGKAVPDGYVAVVCSGEGHGEPYVYLAPSGRASSCPLCDKPTSPSLIEQLVHAMADLGRKVGAPMTHREDRWPLCPMCGEDELYTLDMSATMALITDMSEETKREFVLAIHGCYSCGWTPQQVGPLAEGRVFWIHGEGVSNLGRLPRRGDPIIKHRSVGLSTNMGGGIVWEYAPATFCVGRCPGCTVMNCDDYKSDVVL